MNKTDKKMIYSCIIDKDKYSESKIDLYSILVDMIFSRKILKNSKELKAFTSNVLNFEFADYVFKSRTILLGRILKEIRLMETSDVINIENNIVRFFKTLTSQPIEHDIKAKKEGGFITEWYNVIGNVKRENK